MNNIFSIRYSHTCVPTVDLDYIISDQSNLSYYDDSDYSEEFAADFIERFIIGFITPTIVIIDKINSYTVIGGEKYAKALYEFKYNNLKLTGKYYSELKDKSISNIGLPMKRRFHMSPINVTKISNSKESDYDLKTLFT